MGITPCQYTRPVLPPFSLLQENHVPFKVAFHLRQLFPNPGIIPHTRLWTRNLQTAGYTDHIRYAEARMHKKAVGQTQPHILKCVAVSGLCTHVYWFSVHRINV